MAFHLVTKLHRELDKEDEMIAPLQFGVLFLDWTNPQKAASVYGPSLYVSVAVTHLRLRDQEYHGCTSTRCSCWSCDWHFEGGVWCRLHRWVSVGSAARGISLIFWCAYHQNRIERFCASYCRNCTSHRDPTSSHCISSIYYSRISNS